MIHKSNKHATKPVVRLIPLGGLGEIGMNCMAIEVVGAGVDDVLVLDCGVTFASQTPGVQLIHPDFSWLLENRHRLRAILITHGHEDHIGALPYLLRGLSEASEKSQKTSQPVPIYGPPYALALIKRRLSEHKISLPEFIAMHAGKTFEVASLQVEPFCVDHSIFDALGLILRTPVGTFVHSGDFKIEQNSNGNSNSNDSSSSSVFDAEALRLVAAQKEGVRLLLSDSTNADVEGRSGEEHQVAEELALLIANAPKRVVVAMFASNGHRIQSVVRAAIAAGRKVCLLGRSLETHAAILRDLGALPELEHVLVSRKRARDVPPEELAVLATGTQGEPRAALFRLAKGTHPHLTLEKEDRVILSSRVIPGNEVPVFDIINMLERADIMVIYWRNNPRVHVSGHACREEQKELVELVQPRSFLPVHGTYHHLCVHAALVDDFVNTQSLIVENGAVVEVTSNEMNVVDTVLVGRVHVGHYGAMTNAVLRERGLLAELGLLTVSFPVTVSGKCAGVPRIVAHGLIDEEAHSVWFEAAAQHVQQAVDEFPYCEQMQTHRFTSIETHIEKTLKRFFKKKFRNAPKVKAIAVEISK